MKPNLKDVRISGVLTSQPVDFTLNTNSLGLRGPDVGPKGDRCRILVLGDSTTFGVGVDDVDTYPARVEQLLNEKRPLGRRYQVVNAAGLAYKSWQGLRYLSERGLRLQPDLVIAAFGNCEVDVDDLDIPSQLTGGALRDVLMKSRLVMLTWEKLVKLCSPETTPLLSADARRSRVEQLFGNALLDMWRVCDSNEATLVLLLWPWSPQIYDPRCRSMPRDYEGFCAFLARNQYVLRDVAKETGVCLIDPCQALIAARSTSLYIDGAHVSPEGHDVIAHVIVEALRRSLLEQCATGPSHSPPVPVK
ncbi:MAG: SGNH/GDSL hydrolase family protein [Phycisphaerae bacterium]|nr:SGNH/GDSL hydrolase family protein [Phycisphaerae bacterium]